MPSGWQFNSQAQNLWILKNDSNNFFSSILSSYLHEVRLLSTKYTATITTVLFQYLQYFSNPETICARSTSQHRKQFFKSWKYISTPRPCNEVYRPLVARARIGPNLRADRASDRYNYVHCMNQTDTFMFK